MITRRHIRRWFVWVGIGMGVIGLAGMVVSLVGNYSVISGQRRFDFGGGAISVHWTSSMPVEQLRRDMNGWLWLPWCDEADHPLNKAWRSGRLIIPYWVLVAIGAAAAYRLLPAGYPRGTCAECGYDLKGVPETGSARTCPGAGTRRRKCARCCES